VNALKRVVAYRCQRNGVHDKPVVHLQESSPVRLPPTRPASRSRWRRADVLVAASIALVVMLMLPPAVLSLRQQANRMACAKNLGEVHQALMQYAEDPRHAGFLPLPAREGARARAGIYAPALHEAGYWRAPMQVICPANHRGQPLSPPPTLQELDELARDHPQEYLAVCRNMGGCYAYRFGYLEDLTRKYVGIHQSLGNEEPILADRPPRGFEALASKAGNSPNHGGRGQNVLYLGGQVRFQTDRMIGKDDLFTNRLGEVAHGRGAHDVVLAPSEREPFPLREGD
jgi:hypothetical protein